MKSILEHAMLRSETYRRLATRFHRQTQQHGVSGMGIQECEWDDLLTYWGVHSLEWNEQVEADVLAHEYERLFAHRNTILCPIYEAEYDSHRATSQPSTLADIMGFYRAFGVEVAIGDRPDHLAIELEFMSLLTLKEAFALTEGMEEQAEICRVAQCKFLEDHLGRWCAVFVKTLNTHCQLPYFLLAGHVLKKFVSSECRHTGAKPLVILSRADVPEPDIKCPVNLPESDERTGRVAPSNPDSY